MANKVALHFNKAQMTVMLIAARIIYLIWSRGTGKSTGVLSPWAVAVAESMPGGSTAIVGATYQQLLVRTLPPVIANWERMGYKRNLHYSIGRPFPKSWKVPQPKTPPLNSQNAIYWFNGHYQLLISQDREGSSNGASFQAIMGDEAKYLNKQKLDDELLPTLRGERSTFGHSPYYRSQIWTSDMPTNAKGLWLLDKVNDMDPEIIELIIQLQFAVNKLWYAYRQTNGKSAIAQKLKANINKITNMLTKLRKEAVYYGEANVFDNIDVLGMDYVKDMKRNMSEITYKAGILNLRQTKNENGFYPYLDEPKHGYDAFDYSYLDGFDYDFNNTKLINQDSRHDGDLNQRKPLDIAMDYGDTINTLVVGQEHGREFRLLNGFFVKKPMLVKDVVYSFCDYYKYFPVKEVNFYYDHTAIGGSGTSNLTYESEVLEAFTKKGWEVNKIYVGKAPTHETKYNFWGILLQESKPELPLFRYNKTNCRTIILSMEGAGTKQGRKGVEKDKSTERPNNKGVFLTPPEESTHFSDAVDTLVFFKYNNRIGGGNTSYIPNSIQ